MFLNHTLTFTHIISHSNLSPIARVSLPPITEESISQQRAPFAASQDYFPPPAPPLLKLIEYDPVEGSCFISKFCVDSPNGRRIMLPRSFSLPIISSFMRSLRSWILGGSRAWAARASALSGSSSRICLKSSRLSSSLSASSYRVARLEVDSIILKETMYHRSLFVTQAGVCFKRVGV